MSNTSTSKPHQEIGNVPPEYDDDTLLDEVVELYGRFKKRSAIHTELKGHFPDISIVTVSILISRAKAKIRDTLKQDPASYRGRIIECLEQIISGKTKHRDRLKALEMLANFTGVNIAAMEDPSEYARRVKEAMIEADASVGILPEDANNGSSNIPTPETGQKEPQTTPQVESPEVS